MMQWQIFTQLLTNILYLTYSLISGQDTELTLLLIYWIIHNLLSAQLTIFANY